MASVCIKSFTIAEAAAEVFCCLASAGTVATNDNTIAMAYDPINDQVFIAVGAGGVDVIDDATQTLLGNIATTYDTIAISYATSTGYIYVAEYDGGVNYLIEIINPLTLMVVGSIALPALSNIGGQMAYDSGNDKIYMSSNLNELISINPQTATAAVALTLPGTYLIGRLVAYCSSNNRIYVPVVELAATDIQSILVYNAAFALQATISIGAENWIDDARIYYFGGVDKLYYSGPAVNLGVPGVGIIDPATNLFETVFNLGLNNYGSLVFNDACNNVTCLTQITADVIQIDALTNLLDCVTIATGAAPFANSQGVSGVERVWLPNGTLTRAIYLDSP
jgi:hypothetical protein